MPDEQNRQGPSGDSQSEPPPDDPRVDFPEQGIMPKGGAPKPDNNHADAKNLGAAVHWVHHATFWSQLILALIGLGALRIYYSQLKQMIYATQAAQGSAYDACVSAQIARQTLLEVKSGESDIHNTAAGTVAEAAITTRGDSPLFSFGVGYNQSNPTAAPSAMALSVQNVGRTAARSVRIRYATIVIPQSEDVPPNDRSPFDVAEFGVVPPSFFQGGSVGASLRFLDTKGKPMGLLTPDLWQNLQSAKQYLMTFGRADYKDTFGLSHYQTFCIIFNMRQPDMSTLPEKKLRNLACNSHNQIDKNLIYSIPTQTHENPPMDEIGEVHCVVPSDKNR